MNIFHKQTQTQTQTKSQVIKYQLNDDYKDYVLNEKNILSYLKSDTNKNEKKSNSLFEKIPEPKKIFIPKEHDSLFWCYYIIVNGLFKYETINYKNLLFIKQSKIDYVFLIRENKNIIKIYKFDSISNIENNLTNEDFINLKTVMALFAIQKINVIYVSNKSYYELLMEDNKPIYIIRVFENTDTNSNYKNKSKKYGFEIADEKYLNEIRTNLYKLDSLNKQIKSISYYKLDDLKTIAIKLGIEIEKNGQIRKNKTKNELYEEIIQYFT